MKKFPFATFYKQQSYRIKHSIHNFRQISNSQDPRWGSKPLERQKSKVFFRRNGNFRRIPPIEMNFEKNRVDFPIARMTNS